MRLSAWTAAILLVTCTVLVSGCSAQSPRAESPRVAAQQRELDFVVKKLDLHPMLKNPVKRRAFKAFADRELQLAGSPLPDWRIVEIEERLAAWFRDPHTVASPVVGNYSGSKALPVAFDWLSNGLVTVRMPETPSSVRTGDRVLDISCVLTATVAHRLRGLIGGDAIFVRHLGPIELPADSTLRGLGLVEKGGRVDLRLERADGTRLTVEIALRPQAGALLQAEEPAFESFETTYELPVPELQHGHIGADWTWYVTPRTASLS